MPFGARQDDGWKLCHRKGRTVHTVFAGKYPIVFKSQAKAKACADELNESYWKAYWKKEGKDTAPEPDVFWGVVWVIEKHGGLTAEAVKEMEDNAA